MRTMIKQKTATLTASEIHDFRSFAGLFMMLATSSQTALVSTLHTLKVSWTELDESAETVPTANINHRL